MAEQNVGKIVAIIGPVLDIQFPEGRLPAIYNAVHVEDDGKETGEKIDVIAEVAQSLIDIGYTVRATNTERNLVYPFYVIPAEEME